MRPFVGFLPGGAGAAVVELLPAAAVVGLLGLDRAAFADCARELAVLASVFASAASCSSYSCDDKSARDHLLA